MKKILLIPIGYNCSITEIINMHTNIIHERTPFEWNTSKNIDSIISLFKNNFDGFINENIIPDYLDNKQNAFFNDKYNIVFNHDTKFDKNNKQYYFNKTIILEKYNRRIKRLLEKIKIADILLFVRQSQNVDFRNKTLSVNLLNNKPYPTDENALQKLHEFKNMYNDKEVIISYIDCENELDKFNKLIIELSINNEFI